MRRESLLGGQGRAAGKDRGKRFPAQTALLVISILILLAMLYPVERVRSDNKQLLAELKEARLDLEAHQEALKISRERCESKIKIFTENEVKYQQSIEYYKETDKRLSEQWCQKITEAAMQEYKQVCQRSADGYVRQVEHLTRERDDLIKKMEPISLCCKSATAKNKALLGAEAVAASLRAMKDPDTLKSHKQHVEWHPGGVQRHVDNNTPRTARNRIRLPGLGEEKPHPARQARGAFQ
eukprot:jgi/Tetstr1/460830/TSEL_005991.t1